MNAEPKTVQPMSPPAEAAVTTLFLKPTYGITVQRNTLAVSVMAHPEEVRAPRPHARG
ncbi:hypothetical protein [Melittangium boletus]|uniref:Uncharacterized protein n=1 Tax=Melittangium boletus DSM 14713 TaxID=1294270 RepID=A0A250IJI9_9BACT|nr:hypothetical protein [Melittangium boletus]ATB31428.1 hypothetical protein MEBOL_004891 [Melittangium boletus DSM 14713]